MENKIFHNGISREMTPEEIGKYAVNHFPSPFAKKITAPSELAEQYPGIVAYATLNPDKMQILPENGMAHIYYNKLEPRHAKLVAELGLVEEDL